MQRRRSFVQLCLLPFLVALAAIGMQVWIAGERPPVADHFIYLEIARDLNARGIYTDGPFAEPAAVPSPGRFIAPGYPFFLHAISALDDQVATRIACQVREGPQGDPAGCAGGYASLYAAQTVAGALGAMFVFLIAWTLSRSAVVAWLTLAIALATGYFADFAGAYVTENTAFAAFYAFLYFAVHAVSTGRRWAYVAAGAALSLAALSRPSYVYLAYFTAFSLAALAMAAPKARERVDLASAGLFALASALVLLPWLTRNYLQFGDISLSEGYAPYILAYRVTYNAMSWTEWWVSWIFWLPDFGDELAKRLFRPELYQRLTFHADESYRMQGGVIYAEARRFSSDPELQLRYLLDSYVLGDLVKHALVTMTLAVRGIWAGKYLALAGIALMIPVGRRLHAQGRLLPYLALAAPLFFMAGLHGFVSENVVRYNVPMIALYAFIVAMVLELAAGRLLRRLTGGQAAKRARTHASEET